MELESSLWWWSTSSLVGSIWLGNMLLRKTSSKWWNYYRILRLATVSTIIVFGQSCVHDDQMWCCEWRIQLSLGICQAVGISCVLRYHLEGSGGWSLVGACRVSELGHSQKAFSAVFPISCFNCFVADGSCARLFLPPPWTQEKVTCRMGRCGAVNVSSLSITSSSIKTLFSGGEILFWQIWCHEKIQALPGRIASEKITSSLGETTHNARQILLSKHWLRGLTRLTPNSLKWIIGSHSSLSFGKVGQNLMTCSR